MVDRLGRLGATLLGLGLAACQAGPQTPTPVGSMDSPAAASSRPSGSTGTVTPATSATTSSGPSSSPAGAGAGRWVDAGTMTVPYTRMQGAVLADGRVLVIGTTYRNDEEAPAAELWDPATGTWRATEPLNAVRYDAALVALQDGRALVAGGVNSSGSSYSSAYAFDPGSETWAKVGLLSVARSSPSAAVLPDGRVLVAGGYYRNNEAGSPGVRLATYRVPGAVDAPGFADVDVPPSGYALATAELFDPVTGTWSETGAMRYARTGAPATTLSDGRVLVVGAGEYNVHRMDARAFETSETFDPTAGRFTLTGGLPALDRTALQRLGDPKANPIPLEDPQHGAPGHLVATNDHATLIGVVDWWKHVADLTRSYRYDVTDGRWSEIIPAFVWVGEPTVAMLYVKGVPDRSTAAVAGLADGRVLVAGGEGPVTAVGNGYDTPTTAVVEAYDPAADTWAALAALPEPRAGGQALALPDGSVLVFGGSRSTPDEQIDLATAVRFVP